MKNTDLSIVKIESPEEKSIICNKILNFLPNWFGVPEAITEYTEQVKTLPLFACKTDDDALGFIVIKQYSIHNAEIIVMGVLQEYHRQEIGKKLLVVCENYCLEVGIQCLTVKTLADTHPSRSYAKTRAFYLAMGFHPQMILTDYWDENNPCLVMIKPLSTQALNVIQMQNEHIEFIHEVKFCDSNKATLHDTDMTLDEWEAVCYKSMKDPDETNFIIRKGIVPVAWLKINGLQNKDMAWISMLVVHEKFQQQDIGSFVVRFVEELKFLHFGELLFEK